MRVVLFPSPVMFGVSDNQRVIGEVTLLFRYLQDHTSAGAIQQYQDRPKDRHLAIISEFYGIILFIFRNQGSSEPRCSIALPHDFWIQANGFYRLTACDKSLNLIIITSLNCLNIRTVFDKALNTVADVLPKTPRIEAAR